MSKRRKADTFILAGALFVTTGAILAYNIYSSDGGDVSVSLSELLHEDTVSASLISECAAANLDKGDTVHTSASPTKPPLLPPIVTPPIE